MGNPYLRITQEGKRPYAWLYATYTLESEWPELAPYSKNPPKIEFRISSNWSAGGTDISNVEIAVVVLIVSLDGEAIGYLQVPRRLTIDPDTAAFYYATDTKLDIYYRKTSKIKLPHQYRKQLEIEANQFIDKMWSPPPLKAAMSSRTIDMLGDVLDHAGKYFTVTKDIHHVAPYDYPIKWAIWPSDIPFKSDELPEEPFPIFWMAKPSHWLEEDDYPEPGDVTFNARDIIIAAYKLLRRPLEIDPKTFKPTILDDDPNLLELTELVDEAIQNEKRRTE